MRPLTATLRRAACGLAIVAAGLFPAAHALADGPTVVHHDLAVILHPESGTLAGTDTLTIRPAGAARLSLSLAEGALVTRLTVEGKPYPFTPFIHKEGMLGVPVPEDGRDGEVSVTVAYEGTFRDPVPENPVNTEDPGYGVSGSISPRGVFLSDVAKWYPDIPGSDATFHLHVETPGGFEAVTAGNRIRRETSGGRTFSEWEADQPLPGLSLSAGRYAVREEVSGGITISTWFYPGNEDLTGKYLAAARGYLDLYRDLFGPYPFGKFAVVENFFPTGYGFPSYTLLGSTVIRLPFIAETSLGHEIAHSWWGNGVRVDDGRGNWSEGLTTYVADHLYKERASAGEGREYRLRILREYAALVPRDKDFPLKEFSGRTDPASRAVGYGKGAMVFHMARRLVGDEAFFGGLRKVVREKMFRPVSWDDFDRAFPWERSTDPASFFDQWVERAGAPVLALKDVKAERDGAGWKVRGRLVQEKPYYDLRVPLRLATDGKSIDATVPITGEETRFALWADARPRELAVDPDVDLFRRLDPSEIPPTVNGIKGSTSLLVVAARGLPGDILDASRVLLASLGKEGVPVVREEDTPAARLAGHDVLFLGLPRGKGCLPAFPPSLAATPAGFTLEGTTYAKPGAALFAALPHPADRGRVAAFFLPLSADAAAKAARKITHYGKYSTLAFEDGTNRAKGTWPVTASPTIHVFDEDRGPRDAAGPTPRRTGGGLPPER